MKDGYQYPFIAEGERVRKKATRIDNATPLSLSILSRGLRTHNSLSAVNCTGLKLSNVNIF